MKREISILLPDTIYIKRMKAHQEIVTMSEEYNIYFQNILQPYDEKWDIKIMCPYGRNLGNCYRISDYQAEPKEFDLELVIFDEYGELLASKKSRIVVVDRKENASAKVMFIGDSMTHSQVYVNHILNTLRGIKTVGIRSFDGNVNIEGRGGWSYDSYFYRWDDKYGMSPFLFPKGIAAKDYYGDKTFVDAARATDSETYKYYGYTYDEIKDGQYYALDNKLYKKNGSHNELISDNPEYEFDFAKYIEKFDLEAPQIVSVLLGANDLHAIPYKDSDAAVDRYIEHTKKLIEEIRRYKKDIKIIINMPVICAEQYAWGIQLGCGGSEKMYNFIIKKASAAILKSFDNRQAENIYVSPMLATIDPEYGFPYTYVKANKYTEEMVKKQCNWLHPNDAGYCQMGDALAGVIEYIR